MPYDGDNESPAVTAVVPARNEENGIAAALTSILAQEYAGPLDVVVAVAPSTDRTREIVTDMASRDDRVAVVDNPTGRTPAGLNAAIGAATGEVIVRCDAHAELPPGYIADAITTLEATGAVNVGGIQRAVGVAPMQRAIAAAMSSPFGVGDARFHTGGPAGLVDTVYLGVFRRDALDAVGGYDESLTRNQDYELNFRLRQAGGDIFFDPDLAVVYRPRSSLRGLWRQYFEYGRWKRVVMRRHPGSARWRQFVAPAFVIALGLSGVAAIAGRRNVALIVPAAYGVATLSVTAIEAVKLKDTATAFLPAVFPTMHLAWGLGFLMPGQPSSSDS